MPYIIPLSMYLYLMSILLPPLLCSYFVPSYQILTTIM